MIIPLVHFVSSAKRSVSADLTERGRSLMYMMNNRGPSILPWGTPEMTRSYDHLLIHIAVGLLGTIGRTSIGYQ